MAGTKKVHKTGKAKEARTPMENIPRGPMTDDTGIDRTIARKVQTALIPRRMPLVPGLDITSLSIPSPTMGGDIFDVVQISDDVLVFFIFQVTGHRISSTLISAFAKILFLSHIRSVRSPRAVMERVNAEMIRDVSAEFYLTAFVGYLDLHDNSLTYSNAGHIDPVIYRRDEGSLIHLRSQGTLVGILDEGFYDEKSLYLSPGDRLLLFTDGIIRQLCEGPVAESRAAFDGIIRKKVRDTTPEEFVGYIRKECDAAAEKRKPGDDISLVVTEILAQSRWSQIKEKLGFAPDTQLYLRTLSYFEETDAAVATILSAMDQYGYPDDIIRKMKVSLTELLVNAIHHGNGKDYAKKVYIGHIVDSEKTVVSIMDEGKGFNPLSISDPTLSENLGRDSGRGLFIVRHYVDKMEYNDRGNRITITKFHPYV